MQPYRPPAAQLLYDLGLEAENGFVSEIGPEPCKAHAHYPPLPSKIGDTTKWAVPFQSLQAPLPLQCTEQPILWAAAAARTVLTPPDDNEVSTDTKCRWTQVVVSEIANEFQVDRSSMDMIYMSPMPYYDAFDEVIY